MTVRVSEIYPSIQCEGPRTGMGTIFLRFGGCNLRCPGWPCDSLFAVLPQNSRDWERLGPREVLERVTHLAAEKNIANVCLTGGEPFIQPDADLQVIVDELLYSDINVEMFTNGQVSYPDWAFEKINFVMDWKLGGSGNPATHLTENAAVQLKPTDVIKFVIRDRTDFGEAMRVWGILRTETQAQWWAGVVWESQFREADLIAAIQAENLPWALNVQQHKYLWVADKRGV